MAKTKKSKRKRAKKREANIKHLLEHLATEVSKLRDRLENSAKADKYSEIAEGRISAYEIAASLKTYED